ncbi:hypothetical protein PAHAL_3G201400 [Panicum hallii]|uniref:Uncharacterized protein n=1 Tax=Panicum hallii TaxID=206008 RepID=A0A2S3HA98_9POAL|nr:hypothetical protein PAHAL_3G201400 [Panicum hallii]
MKLLLAREYYCSEELFVHITLEYPSFIFFHHIKKALRLRILEDHYNTLHNCLGKRME